MATKKLAPNLMVEDVNRTVEFYINRDNIAKFNMHNISRNKFLSRHV